MKCQPKKSKFKKKEKKRLEISFYTREPKVMIEWCATDRRMDRHTGRWTNRWMEKVTC